MTKDGQLDNGAVADTAGAAGGRASGEPARPEVRFRRSGFHGRHGDSMPKWHVLAGAQAPDKWGTYLAVCGYSFSNILGQLAVSRAKTRPPRAQMCALCRKATEKH